MGRKRLPAKERRKQILLAAVRCFARHGYRGATTKRIAAEADVAEALLYRYFGSKRELFAESVSRVARHLLNGLKIVFEDHRDAPVDALRAMLETYAETLAAEDNLAKMVFTVSAELDDPDVRDAFLPHQKRALKLIASAIRYWQKGGLVRRDVEPRSIAWLLIGTWQALTLMKHSGQLETMDVDEAVRLALPFLNPPRPARDDERDRQSLIDGATP